VAFQGSGVEGFLQFAEAGELKRQRVPADFVVDGCFRKAIKRLVHLDHGCGLRLGNSARAPAADALPSYVIGGHFRSIPRSRARRSRSRVPPPRCPTSLLSSTRIRATMR